MPEPRVRPLTRRIVARRVAVRDTLPHLLTERGPAAGANAATRVTPASHARRRRRQRALAHSAAMSRARAHSNEFAVHGASDPTPLS